jgi:hypothetical protein
MEEPGDEILYHRKGEYGRPGSLDAGYMPLPEVMPIVFQAIDAVVAVQQG